MKRLSRQSRALPGGAAKEGSRAQPDASGGKQR
jgi:hypothetical protein